MSTQMVGAEEVAKALNTSKGYAYKVIRKLNEEMEEKGMLVVKGKQQLGQGLDFSGYGRKEDEGRDFNEDTNSGKLKRIPYEPLASFLKKHRAGISCPISYNSQELSTE